MPLQFIGIITPIQTINQLIKKIEIFCKLMAQIFAAIDSVVIKKNRTTPSCPDGHYPTTTINPINNKIKLQYPNFRSLPTLSEMKTNGS